MRHAPTPTPTAGRPRTGRRRAGCPEAAWLAFLTPLERSAAPAFR